MSHVFLSYVRENAGLVHQIRDALEEHGIEVWLDSDRILGGMRWRQKIRDAIRNGAYFVACFSKEYFGRTRTHMNEELVIAIEELQARSTERAWFIPLVLSDVEVPDRLIGAGESLRDLQWISLHEDWTAGIGHLVSAIRAPSIRLSQLEHALCSVNRSERLSAIVALAEWFGPIEDARPLILRALKDEDADVRRAAVACIEAHEVSGTDIVLALLHLPERDEAMQDVTAALGHRAVPDLIALLGESEVKTRRRAAVALGTIGPPGRSAIAALVQALNDRAYDVVWASVISLGQLRSPNAVAPLVQLLRGADSHARGLVFEALADMGESAGAAVPALARELTSRNRDTRVSAAKALGEIGFRSKIARPALVVLLENGNEYEKLAAIDALRKIGDHDETALAALLRSTMHNSPLVWGAAIRALKESKEGLTLLLSELVADLESANPVHRGNAALTLGQIGSAAHSMVPVLTELLKDRKARVRANAVCALGQIGGPAQQKAPHVASALRDRSIEVRGEAALTLGILRPSSFDAGPALLRALGDRSGKVRWKAARAIGNLAKSGTTQADVVPKLSELLEDTDSSARAEAAASLRKIGSTRALACLKDAKLL